MTERELSYEILFDTHINGELSHISLKKALDECDRKKAEINKSFVSGLVNGVNERYLTLMFLIEKQSGRPIEKIKPAIRIMLAMGVYQAYYMSVPASAACNETVKLASKRGFSGLKGFVNGVLRGMFRKVENVDEYLEKELKDAEFTRKISVKYSCPEWLVKHYVEECGKEETEKLLSVCFEKKSLTVYGLTSVVSKQELCASFERDEVSFKEIDGICSAYEILSSVNISSLEAYKKGYIIVQDVSSMLATELLPDISGGKVLDVCAAPGGKTIHLADRMASLSLKMRVAEGTDDHEECAGKENDSKASGMVTARDLTLHKIEKINETVKRTGLKNVVTGVFDALIKRDDDIAFYDLVVADLPCSGLGVIGRKQDIKYKTKPEDINSLADIQRKILENVTSYVKPGGYLAYSTCTIAKKENEDNCRFILDRGFEAVDISDRTPDEYKRYLQGNNSLRMLPEKNHDGFYIAIFRENRQGGGNDRS